MTDRKPVRWSSPANAWAGGTLLISFIIPVLVVTDVYQPIALEELFGVWAEAWQWVLLATAAIALTVTLLMQFALGDGRRMQTVIRVEAIATVIVSACYLLLWGALVWKYGFAANPLTQLLVGGLGLTALGRVGQIIWELWKYRRALAAGHTAYVEAIAQPKES